jgi:phospholipid/cholesterol/gamma-HCH transport system permease protein
MPIEKLAFDFSTIGSLCILINQDWRLSAGLPSAEEVFSQLDNHPEIKKITFNISQALEWDSAFISFLLLLYKECLKRNITIVSESLPGGIRELVELTLKAQKETIIHQRAQEPFLSKVGSKVLEIKESLFRLSDFLGEIICAFKKLFSGKAYFRIEDFLLIVQRCGANALGLVSLISLLVGMILAFIGAIQLRIFGAQIFIADIVGIAMIRVMGAVMTGVLLAGRTGASFAAELGVMQVNEEVDALKTFGLNPVELLVMPRLLALVIMTPLLTLYAGLMGVIGGFIVSTTVMGINPIEYFNHTQSAVKLTYLWVGLVHSFVFGIIIAVSGCLRGLNCGRSAEGLGVATTSAVVTAITWIVIATAVITYLCQILGI